MPRGTRALWQQSGGDFLSLSTYRRSRPKLTVDFHRSPLATNPGTKTYVEESSS